MKILHDNVLVTKQKEKEKVTESGLILSADTDTGHKPAVVLAVGDGVPVYLPAETKVIIDWTKAKAVTIDGVQCAVVKYEDVMLIL